MNSTVPGRGHASFLASLPSTVEDAFQHLSKSLLGCPSRDLKIALVDLFDAVHNLDMQRVAAQRRGRASVF